MGAKEKDMAQVRCPLCGGAASLRLSANGLAYLAMDCCKAQLFTRGPLSDELARDLPRVAAAPVTTEPAPVTAAKPAPVKAEPAPEPQTTPAPVKTAPPARKRMGWGLFPDA